MSWQHAKRGQLMATSRHERLVQNQPSLNESRAQNFQKPLHMTYVFLEITVNKLSYKPCRFLGLQVYKPYIIQ